jgi:polysaccharide pyruvyl transferase CsaB
MNWSTSVHKRLEFIIMPTILIGGYYGAGNIGDEAILEAMVGDLRTQRSNRSDLSIIVTSWEPEKTSKELNVEAIYWKDINALLNAALRADLIILGGGGIFHDYWGLDPDTYLRKGFWDITAFGSLPLLAKLLDIPCMIYAVGVGPFQTDLARHHTRLAFERCQIATVRDGESLEFLKQTGFDVKDPDGPMVKVLPDPVFSLTTSSADDAQVADFLRQRHIESGTPLLGVSLRYWDLDGPPAEWLPYVANGILEFLSKNNQVQVILIPFQVLHATPHTNDAIILKKLADLMDMPDRVHLIEDPLKPRFAQALIKHCTVIVGMRLHSVIMGINVGTPVVALSYAPKVWSVMKRAGLEEFGNASLTPKADELAARIQKAWDQRQEFRVRMQPLQEELRKEAKEHARLALDLMSRSQRVAMQFPQQFALEQLRLLEKVDGARDRLENENLILQSQLGELEAVQDQLENERFALQSQVWKLQSQVGELERLSENLNAQLYDIQSSIFWKLGRLPHRFAVMLKREGLLMALRKTLEVIRTRTQPNTKIDGKVDEAMSNILANLNVRSLKGVFVVTSAFVFDELYNQRVINLSKYLAKAGWGVIYVAWVWHDSSEAPPEEVFENIFQIPSNLFLASYAALEHLQAMPRYFVVEFPHPEFLAAALRLRRYDFKIIYEIIDNWEEFHKVGQASWFTTAIEKSFVVNANYLTAVSQPLVEKFSTLRKDIHLIPNGFDPTLLGNHQNIAKRNFSESEIQLGYFGHLTASWFDWDFLLEVLDLAGQRGLNMHVHLIGYGEPNLEERLANYRDRVHFHGKISPAELHDYARDWDVAMIPFKSGKLSEAVDPIKIYEYLYFGLPVIVKGIPHLKDFPEVSVVTNAEQFIETISRLRERKQIKSEPSDLMEFTWEQRFSRLLKILECKEWMSL